MIFSRGKVKNVPHFVIGNTALNVVNDFMYLGLKLNYNNRMKVAQRDLYDRTSRAMFALLRRCSRLKLPLDICLDLFDKTVLPVLTYGCEIWGHEIIDLVKGLQVKFYKLLLKLRRSTPTFMLFGETGRCPVDVHIKCRMLCFWFKLISQENSNRLSSLIYKFLLNMFLSNRYKSSYLLNIKECLENIGMSGFWINQVYIQCTPMWFKAKVKRSLTDAFIQSWYSVVDDRKNEMYTNYRMFKTSFGQESYLSLLPSACVIKLFQFRTTNNILPVNNQRFEGIMRNERKCQKCNSGDIGDEFHYIFKCRFFNRTREELLPLYYRRNSNAIKFQELFDNNKKSILLKIVHFINCIRKELKDG